MSSNIESYVMSVVSDRAYLSYMNQFEFGFSFKVLYGLYRLPAMVNSLYSSCIRNVNLCLKMAWNVLSYEQNGSCDSGEEVIKLVCLRGFLRNTREI